ncbi:hypothetical protein WR25_25025 [Diploscapter pachys]|uniref:G-protein coupled receptors family 1 profile domain-containing protein n=1 Tax=Diploscapter pachys TaxID=2018661 RepID=A0A2A2KMD7_9BILA|nr:hypothetical protein WR25_25025 [Diploscapter pachys]
MICVWDSLYLISCLVTYCLPSIFYSVTPIYGLISYVLFVVQPFASFCVSCTIWQIFAITLERYWAVTAPLEQRTRKAKFAVGWICVSIVLGAFAINLLPIPFESELVPCIEMPSRGEKGSRVHTLFKPYMGEESRMYRFIVHFFPDLIFRAPLPIIIIGILTVKTIQVCNQRNVAIGHINIQMKRNIPLRLSVSVFFMLYSSDHA